jgi:hypothetical protein
MKKLSLLGSVAFTLFAQLLAGGVLDYTARAGSYGPLTPPVAVGGVIEYEGRVPWSQANVDALRGADKATVAKFVNATRPRLSGEIEPNQVAEFAWAKGGRGKTNLVVALDISGRGYYTVWIYGRGKAGSLRIQEISGWKVGSLSGMLRDLNGDGTDQLIVLREIGRGGAWTPTTGGPKWPAVYRLEDGGYREASRDFPKFYDTEILPDLDRAIDNMKKLAPEGGGYPGALAQDELERDKILRVLGRNPTAGLKEAYQWMDSDDPQVLQCAIATFYEIGGHEEELRAAQQRLPGVVRRAIELAKSSSTTHPPGRVEVPGPRSRGESAQQNTGASPAQGTVVHSEGAGVGAPVR